ncbi:MAG: GNAT family N-acetyltransferase [Desulfobulbaceae bacterium A2]|nr:MAG: GNAT family N-acetyltransferase [Desulfobulbaceae bacterium A2]
MTLPAYDSIRKLEVSDKVSGFDCGEPELNMFLQHFALINQKAHSTQTYACCQGGEVAGFYSLAVGSVEPAAASKRVAKGLSRHPIPVMLLARLAVDLRHQRGGLGRALLKDALRRTLHAADIAGIRAIVVHAKNETARAWYLNKGFEPSPTDPYHLFLLMKDLRASVSRQP